MGTNGTLAHNCSQPLFLYAFFPPTQNVLFVGPERADEFESALRLTDLGHSVIAVNPRETSAARCFQQLGGTFVKVRIEQISRGSAGFDLILENYPYPGGRHYHPPRSFALARLSRLTVNGRWIVFTESARYATLVKAVVDHDVAPSGRYCAKLYSVPSKAAPPSCYPPIEARYQLIVRRMW